MYRGKFLLFLRTLTPTHVGLGRGYAGYVDQPIQRDEFGFPTIWSSSLKGAIKANITGEVRKCLGPDPDELESASMKQSRVTFTDAKLLLIPVRVISGVYAYATSLHLLEQFSKYVEALQSGEEAMGKKKDRKSFLEEMFEGLGRNLLDKLRNGEVEAITSSKNLVRGNYLIANETPLIAQVVENLGGPLVNLMPDELRDKIKDKLVVVTDANNVSLNLVNKSIIVQHRVRLGRDTKTVEHGPWSEEYLPSETILASLVLCRDSSQVQQQEQGSLRCDADTIKNELKKIGVLFVGGMETIGKGLLRVYTS
ncbi:MAG: type III-B CRISPR module RAMP protein Cmr4 [Thermofilaceae archaeon]